MKGAAGAEDRVPATLGFARFNRLNFDMVGGGAFQLSFATLGN